MATTTYVPRAFGSTIVVVSVGVVVAPTYSVITVQRTSGAITLKRV